MWGSGGRSGRKIGLGIGFHRVFEGKVEARGLIKGRKTFQGKDEERRQGLGVGDGGTKL